MYEAAQIGNKHLAFMSLITLSAMMNEIWNEVDINKYDVLKGYDADDLYKTAKAYDDILYKYQQEYTKAGIHINSYSNIDAFVQEYLVQNSK